MQTIRFWPKGYASDPVLEIVAADHVKPLDAVIAAGHSSLSKISRVVHTPDADPDAAWTLGEPAAHEAAALAWVFKQDGGALAQRISDVRDQADLVRAEAGRYWRDCPFTDETLGALRRELRALFDEAVKPYAAGLRATYAGDNS